MNGGSRFLAWGRRRRRHRRVGSMSPREERAGGESGPVCYDGELGQTRVGRESAEQASLAGRAKREQKGETRLSGPSRGLGHYSCAGAGEGEAG
jgi:hypothetical protein